MTIEIHLEANVSALADLEDSKRGSLIRVGAGSMIDSFVKVKPVGGNGDLIIGERVFINSGCMLYTGNGIIIGNNVSIAANCVFAPVNHEFSARDRLIQAQGFQPSRGGIIVEDDVWIGAGCVILDGAILRKGCVIGAASVVRFEVPSYTIQGGNPLRLLGRRK